MKTKAFVSFVLGKFMIVCKRKKDMSHVVGWVASLLFILISCIGFAACGEDNLVGTDEGAESAEGVGNPPELPGIGNMNRPADAQVGDILLADGTFYRGNENEMTEVQKAKSVAIVFAKGHHESDNSDYTHSGIRQKKCHGYAVALKDAAENRCMWGSKIFGRLGLFPTDSIGNPVSNRYFPEKDWSGYAYTQIIIEKVGGKENLKPDDVNAYPATYYSVNYSGEAPATSSGWFLPAIGQLWHVCMNLEWMEGKSGQYELEANRGYWSSSEHSDSPSYSALLVYDLNDNSKPNAWDKDAENYVRPILAF